MGNIFIDGLEKIINEHGSSTILEQRLLLAKDQYLALEKKNVDLLTINQSLSQKILTLEAENSSLKAENMKINKEINDVNKNKSNLPKDQEKMLVFISQHSEDLQEEFIVNQTGLNFQKALFYLNDLTNIGYVYANRRMGVGDIFGGIPPTTYRITQKGRKYLIDNNIL